MASSKDPQGKGKCVNKEKQHQDFVPRIEEVTKLNI